MARSAQEISRRSRDRARVLWKPSCAITSFRVSMQICRVMTIAIEIFFAIEKIFFDRVEIVQESR